MPRMIFVNLPVTNVARATDFHSAIGMTKDDRRSDEHASAMVWSDTITFMLETRAPQVMGFMHSRAFEDPDGHAFEPMHLDLVAAEAALSRAA